MNVRNWQGQSSMNKWLSSPTPFTEYNTRYKPSYWQLPATSQHPISLLIAKLSAKYSAVETY